MDIIANVAMLTAVVLMTAVVFVGGLGLAVVIPVAAFRLHRRAYQGRVRNAILNEADRRDLVQGTAVEIMRERGR